VRSIQLRQQLEVLAQEFVTSVLSAIRSVPLEEIARELDKTSSNSNRGKHTKSRQTASQEPKDSPMLRRSSKEIVQLREGILQALKASPSPMGASQIARAIGGNIQSSALSFPMKQLRRQGLISKSGDRTQAVYSLTEKGKAGNEVSTNKPQNKPAKLPKIKRKDTES